MINKFALCFFIKAKDNGNIMPPKFVYLQAFSGYTCMDMRIFSVSLAVVKTLHKIPIVRFAWLFFIFMHFQSENGEAERRAMRGWTGRLKCNTFQSCHGKSFCVPYKKLLIYAQDKQK